MIDRHGWADRWMDRRRDGRTDRQTDEQIDIFFKRQMNGQTDECKGRWMNGLRKE
jgi:hypothetical protein